MALELVRVKRTFMEITQDLSFPFPLFLCFWFWKMFRWLILPFHATALELYHNFSFAAQLFSIFMLLNDAALSTSEWHFRAVSTIKGNLRQIKLLWVFFFLLVCLFVFCWRRAKGSHPQGCLLFFRPIKTVAKKSIYKKEKIHPSLVSE